MTERDSRSTELPLVTEFLALSNQEIAEIVKQSGHPKNVAVMIDGTRRLLKLEPEHHQDSWLYGKDHIDSLMYRSAEVTNNLFEMGIDVVTAPLVSYGNLHRDGFVPGGLERLLQPLVSDEVFHVLLRHNATVHFYGDLDAIRQFPKGSIVDRYLLAFNQINEKIPSPAKKILIGLGFTTDRETTIISHKAIDFYNRIGRYPTQPELIIEYFGFEVPSIDIFIRTNELKASGGLTPLLTEHDTQFYFPTSPGLISLNEANLKRILFDYLFNRNLSGGRHQHQPITDQQAAVIRNFYNKSINQITGVGRRVGDIWIQDPE